MLAGEAVAGTEVGGRLEPAAAAAATAAAAAAATAAEFATAATAAAELAETDEAAAAAAATAAAEPGTVEELCGYDGWMYRKPPGTGTAT